MKKPLLALAVLGAFAGAAQAQTSVTVYGSFDGGVRHQTNVGTTAATRNDDNTTIGSNGTFNSNRIGFRGVEDLGGGMKARFTLETGFNTGTGALDNATTTTTNVGSVPVGTSRLFNRTAAVGIGGDWGWVDLGRQYSINFQTIGLYDPFSYKYTGIIPLAAQAGLTRLDNDIKYTGTFGPVTARVEYALGEVTGSSSNAAAQAIGLSYAGGPVTVGGAYTQQKRNIATAAATAPAANFQDLESWTLGAAYVAGPFRLATGYAQATQDTSATTETEVKDIWLGGSYSLSPAVQLTAAYYRTTTDTATTTGRRKLLIIGATYALSKRTNFYADIDNFKFSGASIPASTATTRTGLSVGINHLF